MQIVFFDGICGLCNHFVQFLLSHDKQKRLKFSPLQGKTIEKTKAISYREENTLVFVKEGQVFIRSTAAIESIAALGRGWVLVRFFLLIPRWIRDGIYLYIANHRYRWFGKKELCYLPKKEEKPYFLE